MSKIWVVGFYIHGLYPIWIKTQKFVNLEYHTLVRWANGKNVSSTKRLMFQVQSNLEIRNFFVALKLFLNAKNSLFL